MSQKLPKEISVKIESATEIKLFADGVEFPFDISSLQITYTPEDGFYYGISAGYGTQKEQEIPIEYKERAKQPVKSILPNANNIMSPSKMGIVPMDDDDSDGLSLPTSDKKDLGPNALKVLSELYPERSDFIVASAPRGWEDFGFKRVDTDSKMVETDDDIRELLIELSESEKEVFEGGDEGGHKCKYVYIQSPTLVWEDDKSAYIEERFKVYGR